MKIYRPILPLLLFAVSAATAQTVDIEKTYDVSKEAMKGFIHMIQPDEAKQQLDVIYRVRAKKDMAKFITYTFDFNFNMINQQEEVINMKQKLPAKYSPKKYKGEDYEVEGLYVQPNMLGSLILKRKVTTFHWSWFEGRYKINTTVAGKLKATTDDDKKLYYYNHVEDPDAGTAMILAGEKGKVKENGGMSMMMNFHFLKYDINLNKLADIPINFETPQAVVAFYGYPHNDEDTKTDIIVVFAPFKGKGYMGPDIFSKSATSYTYVRVTYDGKLVDKVQFESPNSMWRIDDFVLASNGAVYFYGPSNDEKDVFNGSNADLSNDKKKWPRFQLAKFQDGKMQYVSSTSMDDFNAKLKPQPDGKKGDPYNGRRVTFSDAVISPIGDVVLAGQNYGIGRSGGREYEDLLLFHFDAKGNLVSEYTMNKKQKGTSPDYQYFEFSDDGKSLYWTYFDNVGTKQVKEMEAVIEKPLGVPKMGKINLSTGAFEKYTEYGKGENYVHYGGVLNYLRFTNTNKVNYLGENKKGSSLWFVRVNLDN